jgi:hypothetical protein
MVETETTGRPSWWTYRFSNLYVLFCLVDYSKMFVSVAFQNCRKEAQLSTERPILLCGFLRVRVPGNKNSWLRGWWRSLERRAMVITVLDE